VPLCHVMAHESSRTRTTSAFMNENFVIIKVDSRKKRPDLDDILYAATLAFNRGSGGGHDRILDARTPPFTAGRTPRGRARDAGLPAR